MKVQRQLIICAKYYVNRMNNFESREGFDCPPPSPFTVVWLFWLMPSRVNHVTCYSSSDLWKAQCSACKAWWELQFHPLLIWSWPNSWKWHCFVLYRYFNDMMDGTLEQIVKELGLHSSIVEAPYKTLCPPPPELQNVYVKCLRFEKWLGVTNK